MVAASPSCIVTCRELTKEFVQGSTPVRALRGVNLDVYPGELTLLVGPSGCGKTTLLSVIAGILDLTAGAVHVLDRDLTLMAKSERVEFRGRHIGFVFQQYNLLPALTAVENVAVPLIIAGRPRRAALVKARELLDGLGMSHRMHALPPKLSGGEQQRVAIARAMVHDPRLLVCDEPTSALDGHTGHTIMELLRRVAVHRERAVVVVTHDSRVFEFADRIAYMDDGQIVRIEEKR
jgi:putative ABC transport system ATP-binding protein